jgi:hypothetical protein
MVTTTEIIHFEAEPKKSPSESIPIDLEANLPPWRRQHKLRANPVEPAQVTKRSDDMATEEDMRQVYKTYRSLVEARRVALEQEIRQVALEEGPKAMETAGNVSVQVQEERTYQVHPLPPIPLPPKKNEVKQTLSISGSETESQGRAQLVRAQFWKTELCRFYPKCRKGDLCPFAHTDLEVKDRPNLTKTSLCAAWSKNCCPFLASECKFAHGSSQLRKTGLFSTAAEGRGKKEQLQKGGAAKVKKQQQRLAREKEFEIELGTPSDQWRDAGLAFHAPGDAAVCGDARAGRNDASKHDASKHDASSGCGIRARDVAGAEPNVQQGGAREGVAAGDA